MLQICLVEDNKKLGDLLQQELLDAGYACDRYTSVELIHIHKIMRYHIFLLDVMLPGESGLEFAQRLRKQGTVGIIFLTAKSAWEDKEEGFEAGADDYITKPFKTKELFFRIDALAKRLEPIHFFEHNGVFIDRKNRLAKVAHQVIHLTPTEREVLGCLIANKGLLCHRADLIEYVRGTDELFGMNRSLDVTIVNIRKKIGKECIETLPGLGYRLATDN